METINSSTLTQCQHCGKVTNYAGEAHQIERERKIATLEAKLHSVQAELGAAQEREKRALSLCEVKSVKQLTIQNALHKLRLIERALQHHEEGQEVE